MNDMDTNNLKEGDSNLDLLLDEALEDFDKPLECINVKTHPKARSEAGEGSGHNDHDTPNELELEMMFADLKAKLGLNANGPHEAGQEVLPIMETMMQGLLSKELLYPPLKDLQNKFPDWLADNRDSTLSEDEYVRFNNQYTVVKRICAEFEAKISKMIH